MMYVGFHAPHRHWINWFKKKISRSIKCAYENHPGVKGILSDKTFNEVNTKIIIFKIILGKNFVFMEFYQDESKIKHIIRLKNVTNENNLKINKI